MYTHTYILAYIQYESFDGRPQAHLPDPGCISLALGGARKGTNSVINSINHSNSSIHRNIHIHHTIDSISKSTTDYDNTNNHINGVSTNGVTADFICFDR